MATVETVLQARVSVLLPSAVAAQGRRDGVDFLAVA